MFARIAAALLVALTLTPFTAPFATCDLAALFGGALPAASRITSSRSPTAEAAPSHVGPLVRSVGRTRLTALSGPGAVNAIREFPAGAIVPTDLPAISTALVLRVVLRI